MTRTADDLSPAERRTILRTALRNLSKTSLEKGFLAAGVPPGTNVSSLTKDQIGDTIHKVFNMTPREVINDILAREDARQPVTPGIVATPAEAAADADAVLANMDSTAEDTPAIASLAAEALAPLDVMRPMLSPKIIADLEASVNALAARAAQPARTVPGPVVIKIQRVRVAEDGTETPVDGETLASDAPATPAARVDAARAFGLKPSGKVGRFLSGVMLDVWANPNAPAVDPDFLINPELLARVAPVIARNGNLFLYGPHGSGKSTWLEQLAAYLGRPAFIMGFDKSLEPQEAIGGRYLDNGRLVWRDGALLAAIRVPGAIIGLDEVTMARPGMLAMLQVLMASRSILVRETGERVDVAPGVMFVALDNTPGTGDATGIYADTQVMNAAFLDRWEKVVRVDYLPAAFESKALAARTGCAPALADALVDFAGKTRLSSVNGDLTAGLGFRRLLAWARDLSDGQPASVAWDDCVLNATRAEDAATLTEMYRAHVQPNALEALAKGHAAPAPSAPLTPAGQAAAQDFDAVDDLDQ